MRYFLICVLICTSFYLQGQSITGRVQDSNTLEAIPFANVFINNTTIGTVTDINGEFNLTTLKEPGTYELVFSFVGYEVYKRRIAVGENVLNAGNIRLIPSKIELNAVEVKSARDKDWEKNLKKFKKIFLGADKQAAACTIINPWVIDFEKGEGNKFIAKASAPIEIENKALGYSVVFYLTNFWQSSNEYSILGNVRFNELKSTDDREVSSWRTSRRKSYQHSTQHLFKSIIDHRINGEGFTLYTDSENNKKTTTRSAQFYSEIGKTVIPFDTAELVSRDIEKGFYRVTMTTRVEVHDRIEKARIPVYSDVFGSVSWITLNKGFIVVNRNGFPKRPEDIIVSGDMTSGRVAQMLPLDYQPDQLLEIDESVDYDAHLEQIYIHTDKPYYYPGETIWFKGYMNYATPAWRDSLSRTVYVELIDRALSRVVMTKTLEIINGKFYNEFQLPEILDEKVYYLRAYTNFGRNFGNESLFVRALPVLNLTDIISPDSSITNIPSDGENLLTVTAYKKKYRPHEKITITLKSIDEVELPISANLSIAVVDSTQVTPINNHASIHENYPIRKPDPRQVLEKLPYAIEYGVSFSGIFLNDKKEPERAPLTILQMNPRTFGMAQSDDLGFFTIVGLSFYDTAKFSVQATRGKGEVYGKAEFVNRLPAPIEFKESDFQLAIINTESPQRSFSKYVSTKDSRVLKDVLVESTKIEEEHQPGYRVKRPYGKPDYVISKKNINSSYGNLLQTLPGKVPGLIVREVINNGQLTRKAVYLQRGGSNSSLLFPKEVIVTINDVMVNGTPEEILSTIDPATVESIEVKTGINVLYGSLGGNGILSVYTKKELEQPVNLNTLPVMKVPGYSRPQEFFSPEYEKPTKVAEVDERSTIFWDPEVITDSATGEGSVSFYASDRSGKYRIIVEGLTQKGEPVRAVYFIEVGDL
jgi:hypothetical protein